MYFLIDYENVNYAGLEGTEYLEKSDTISFFFGEESGKIINYRMVDILNSGCEFEICRLVNVRKNALDFYIASRVGEIFAVDRSVQIAIISADKDHQSVIDYWKPRLLVPNQLVRAKTIAKAIKLVNGEGARKKIVNERMKPLDLQTEFGKYEERKRILQTLEEGFCNTEYEHIIPQIFDIVITADKPRTLYLNSLKSLGRKRGIDVYRKIKCSIANV